MCQAPTIQPTSDHRHAYGPLFGTRPGGVGGRPRARGEVLARAPGELVVQQLADEAHLEHVLARLVEPEREAAHAGEQIDPGRPLLRVLDEPPGAHVPRRCSVGDVDAAVGHIPAVVPIVRVALSAIRTPGERAAGPR